MEYRVWSIEYMAAADITAAEYMAAADITAAAAAVAAARVRGI